MKDVRQASHTELAIEPLSGSEKQLVQKALEQMLQSPPFRTSRQCQDLLRYIVNHSLLGEEEALRERVIGVEVFGRRPDYDTAEDPVVRMRAAEVRKRLALYLQTAHGAEASVRINIPSGSYRATFEGVGENHKPSTVDQAANPPEALAPRDSVTTEPPSPQTDLPRRSHRWKVLLACACALVVVLAALRFQQSADERAFNRFWSPLLGNPNPALIYIGSNAVYEMSPAYMDSYRKQHSMGKAEQMGLQFFVPLSAGQKLDAGDLVPVKDTFVTIGDVAATTKIVSLLVRRNKPFDVRYGNDIVYGDLRQSPTVLVGAYNNLWTIAMTDNLRFVFDSGLAIQDRFATRRWTASRDFTDDYAIVSRVLNSKTGGAVITAAGIGQAGTRAAGEFVTNPRAIASAMKTAPRGWEQKNMQIVLHTTVINQLPSAPEVVATYYW